MSQYDVNHVTSELRRTSLSQDAGSDLSNNSRSSRGSRSSGDGATNGLNTNIGSARKSSVASTDGWTEGREVSEPYPPTAAPEQDKGVKPKRQSLLKRFTSRAGKDKKGEKPKVSKFDKILMEVKVDSLPQVFVTKYMGFRPCGGLWGIKHTRPPVEELISEISAMDPEQGEDLPLAQLKVSLKGIHVKEHSANICKTRQLEKGLIPIEFISYGVQDVRYTRVFAFVLVREMSSKNRKLECHAYVCDSTASCRKLSLSVAMAFQEYSQTLEGQPFKFQVDLNNSQPEPVAESVPAPQTLGPDLSLDGDDFEV